MVINTPDVPVGKRPSSVMKFDSSGASPPALMPKMAAKPTISKTTSAVTFSSENQNSASPNHLTEKALSKNSSAAKITH